MTGSSLPLRASAVRSRPVALQRLVAVLGVGVVHALVAADLAQDVQDGVARHAVRFSSVAAGRLRRHQRQQQVLGGDVLVLEGVGLAQRVLQDAVAAWATSAWPAPRVCGQRAERPLRLLGDGGPC
jgi:hypothetical protein